MCSTPNLLTHFRRKWKGMEQTRMQNTWICVRCITKNNPSETWTTTLVWLLWALLSDPSPFMCMSVDFKNSQENCSLCCIHLKKVEQQQQGAIYVLGFCHTILIAQVISISQTTCSSMKYCFVFNLALFINIVLLYLMTISLLSCSYVDTVYTANVICCILMSFINV